MRRIIKTLGVTTTKKESTSVSNKEHKLDNNRFKQIKPPTKMHKQARQAVVLHLIVRIARYYNLLSVVSFVETQVNNYPVLPLEKRLRLVNKKVHFTILELIEKV